MNDTVRTKPGTNYSPAEVFEVEEQIRNLKNALQGAQMEASKMREAYLKSEMELCMLKRDRIFD